VLEAKQRRWKWLGNVLRMNKIRHPQRALRWAQPEKWHIEKPLGNWRRTMEEEIATVGKTWNEIS